VGIGVWEWSYLESTQGRKGGRGLEDEENGTALPTSCNSCPLLENYNKKYELSDGKNK
jgi:hypothetical protein